MKAWMTYNPACGTARNVLATLRGRGIEPQIREYLKQPLTRAEITDLVAQMGGKLSDVVRWKQEAEVAAAGITPAGQRYAEKTFGTTAPQRATFADGADGDAAHADALQAHLINELGAELTDSFWEYIES